MSCSLVIVVAVVVVTTSAGVIEPTKNGSTSSQDPEVPPGRMDYRSVAKYWSEHFNEDGEMDFHRDMTQAVKRFNIKSNTKLSLDNNTTVIQPLISKNGLSLEGNTAEPSVSGDEVDLQVQGDTARSSNGEENPPKKSLKEIPRPVYNVRSAINTFDCSNEIDYILLKSKEDQRTLTKDAQQIINSGFKTMHETKVVIHGYIVDHRCAFSQDIGQQYASYVDGNVILVDWGKISKRNMIGIAGYEEARDSVQKVGECVGEFLIHLFNASLIKPQHVHLVGHSLGAHVSGDAGITVQKNRWGKIARITGLDPAGTEIDFSQHRWLTKDDAEFVDVIHTCTDGWGTPRRLGHVDFYPNGGTFDQPGCTNIKTAYEYVCDFVNNIYGNIVSHLLTSSNTQHVTARLALNAPKAVCSHGRSYEYFNTSIAYPKAFVAKFCKDEHKLSEEDCDSGITAIMGEALSLKNTKKGIYYLTTTDTTPFF